jgi:hypothetical protein
VFLKVEGRGKRIGAIVVGDKWSDRLGETMEGYGGLTTVRACWRFDTKEGLCLVDVRGKGRGLIPPK